MPVDFVLDNVVNFVVDNVLNFVVDNVVDFVVDFFVNFCALLAPICPFVPYIIILHKTDPIAAGRQSL
jgi:hypothetical protein